MAVLATAFPDSSAIDRATYDDDSGTLQLWYAGGDRYLYFDVPPEFYQALKRADSAGEFVNHWIKPNFRYEHERRKRRFRPD